MAIVAPFYILALAYLSLYGFWSQFHFDYFKFISSTDILPAALYPMTGSIAIFLLIALYDNIPKGKNDKLIGGTGLPSGIERFLTRWAEKIIVSWFIVTFFVMGTVSHPIKWFVLLPFIAYAEISFGRIEYVIDQIPNIETRELFLRVVFLMPLMLLVISSWEGWGIIKSNKGKIVHVEDGNGKIVFGPMVYLGQGGDKSIYYNVSKRDVSVRELGNGEVLVFEMAGLSKTADSK